MANEITATGSLSCTKNSQTTSIAGVATANLTGDQVYGATQVFGTSYEILAVPDDLSNEASGGAQFLCVRNLNSTGSDYVDFSYQANDTGRFARLKPGQSFMVPVTHWGQVAAASVPVHGKASANTVECSVAVLGT